MQALRHMPPHLLLPVLTSLAGMVLLALLLGRADGAPRRTRLGNLAKVLGVVSIAAVLAVTLLDGATPTRSEWRAVNLVPGETISRQLRNLSPSLGALNIVGNIVLFVPVTSGARDQSDTVPRCATTERTR